MGVTLLRDIVNDISVDFKQNFDDRQIQDSQIAYWTIICADRIKSQHIDKRSSGKFLHTFPEVPIVIAADNSEKNKIKGRKRIDLPKNIYDFDKDGGIDYIAYWRESEVGCREPFTIQTFQRTTIKDSETLYYSDYEKPSPVRPYFYVLGESVYFLGIECADIEEVEIGLYATFDSVREIDFDMVLDFPAETLLILKRQVMDLGRFALMIPKETVNEGSDKVANSQVPTSKLVSVNDPINTTQENTK